MRKQDRNYIALSELLDFATGTEGELANLDKDEIRARLEGQGFDPARIAAKVRIRMKRIQNEAAAQEAGLKLTRQATPMLSIADMRTALEHRGVPIAARLGENPTDEDIEVLYRLSFDDNEG